jgi:hypothetical protein
MLVAMASGSALFVVCTSTTSTASTTTYRAGSVQFQAYFLSRVTTTALTKADLGSSFSGVSVVATLFSAGMDPSEAFPSSDAVPKPNAFAVLVLTFSSPSVANTGFQGGESNTPGVKKETLDGRRAYVIVGNAAAMNRGTPVPDKKATQGTLVVLDGKSIVTAATETKGMATTTSFLNSLKVLS